VKTYRRKGNKVTLVPSNARLQPMVFDVTEVAVYGKVVTVMRRM
jgi:repressor LexA